MIRYLEQRFGRFAVPNITLIVIVGQVMMYVATQRDPTLIEKMVLLPTKVMEGEIFRLLSFTMMPPADPAILAFFYWYLFYLMGTALEQFWGTFRYNLFLMIGYLATVAVAFITPDAPATNWFLQGTVFLAFAWLNPNFTLHIFFVLPVRIKWLALLTWIGFGFTFLFGTWSIRLGIAASVLNFFVFFGREVWHRIVGGQRHMLRQVSRLTEKPPEYLHICEVCGITDSTHPNEDFRYCSKCEGDLAYCSEHLKNHAHLVNVLEES